MRHISLIRDILCGSFYLHQRIIHTDKRIYDKHAGSTHRNDCICWNMSMDKKTNIHLRGYFNPFISLIFCRVIV